jgi:RNA polymerase sigma-70 factor (ECF subfamily)
MGNSQQQMEQHLEHLYKSHRNYLFSVAYRLLGSVAEAEDVVQELFAAMREDAVPDMSSPRAYLARAVTNRCLNILKSARRRRETYVGPWLPEPLVQTVSNPLEMVEQADEMSYAYLVLLEQLTPQERAAFVLREAFAYEYGEIAGMMDKSEAACRKLVSRARKKLEESRQGEQAAQKQVAPMQVVQKQIAPNQDAPKQIAPNQDAPKQGAQKPEENKREANKRKGLRGLPPFFRPQRERELIRQWVTALSSGNIEQVMDLIAEDAVLFTDGGGKVRSALNPIYGRLRVSALLRTLAARRFSEATLRSAIVNGALGIVAVKDGRVISVVCFEWNPDGTVRRLFTVLNPEKLERVAAT